MPDRAGADTRLGQVLMSQELRMLMGKPNISWSAKYLKGITTGMGVDRKKTSGLRHLNQQNK